MAALIEQGVSITPSIVEGARGEFSVWVDGTCVAKKTSEGFPTDEDSVTAVKAALGLP